MFPSRFHFPAPLGSTGISRFIATTGTLTPAPLFLAPGQVSLVHTHALPDIPSPTTPCAPAFRRYFLLRAGLANDSLFFAIVSSSDFAHYSQSHQSHKAVSSLCRRLSQEPKQFYGLSIHFQLLSTSCCHERSYLQLLAGSTAKEGLSPSNARSLSSARARTLVRFAVRMFKNPRNLRSPCDFER